MKKAVILCALCVMVLCAACAKKEAAVQEPVTEAEEKSAGLANPMVEVTKEELMEQLGFKFNVPDGAEDVRYFIINKELAEMQFTFNTVKISARIKATAEYEDISGMYYTWDVKEKAKVSYNEADVFVSNGENESAQVIMWYDVAPGIMYSVSAIGKDLDGFDIQAIAEQTYVQTQGDVG